VDKKVINISCKNIVSQLSLNQYRKAAVYQNVKRLFGKKLLLTFVKVHFKFLSLQVFYEEELDVPLVLFDEVLDHVLRIDRIFRQPQGHVLLIGVSGAGKTTLSRFVAWMNGLTVYQIKVHNKYTAADFDEDLRIVLRRSGCKVRNSI
jgi:ABC-type polysaccharide/polyol phosphate transport system ATPase subunit